MHSARVALVIELEVPKDGAVEWVRLVTSIPGREGTLSGVIYCGPEGLTADGWLELQAQVLSKLSTTLELLGGAQLRLSV